MERTLESWWGREGNEEKKDTVRIRIKVYQCGSNMDFREPR